MVEYVPSALLIYSEEAKEYVTPVLNNPFDVDISALPIDQLIVDDVDFLGGYNHIVVCGSLDTIKKGVHLAVKYDMSLGVIPLKSQPMLIKSYGLPRNTEEAISLALQNNSQKIDLVYCNDQLMLLKARVGRIPLIDSPENTPKSKILTRGLNRIKSLQLLPFKIRATGKNNNELSTAASGCILFANHERTFTSRIISHDSSLTDGLISMIVVAPISVVDYLRLMMRTIIGTKKGSASESIGFITSPQIDLQTDKEYTVYIDGQPTTKTPIHCHVEPTALKLNHKEKAVSDQIRTSPGKEKFVTKFLPADKELIKAHNKKVPFFTYASEERFKDLFVALRADAKLNSSYLVLMVLSTVLAGVGLYMNSASVIIGAMLLAPLMAPIISMAMGILRMDRNMFKHSTWKIVIGVLLALSTAALMARLFSYQPLTQEMQARLNPTLLDLGVAIIAGIAGAYTKSYKEILQSLAGVAIAVALVPPLATAGIGIGRIDLEMFKQAFLLFTTNFIGIVLAATIAFRVLGFSAVVRDKKGLIVVCFFFLFLTVPLFLAYQSISEKALFEQSWKVERFLVNDKYLVVKKASLSNLEHKNVLTVDLLARDLLNRKDLQEFKRKVNKNFSQELVVRANITYIP